MWEMTDEQQRIVEEAIAKQDAATKELLGAKPTLSQVHSVICLRVEVCEVVPTIWRVVRIGAWMNLAELHEVIQRSFDWHNKHLHSFQIGAASFGSLVEDLGDTVEDELRLTLANLLAAGVKEFSYEYDFGDSWLHRIEILGTEPLAEDNAKPRCLAGERAGPLEDVGGSEGYLEILKALAASSHPNHKNAMRRIEGTNFHPDYFNIDETNKELNRYRWRTP